MQIVRSGGLGAQWFESEFFRFPPNMNVICDITRMARGCLADLDHKSWTTRRRVLWTNTTKFNHIVSRSSKIDSLAPSEKHNRLKRNTTPLPQQANNHEIHKIWTCSFDQERWQISAPSRQNLLNIGVKFCWVSIYTDRSHFLSLPSLQDLWSQLFTAFLDTVEDSFASC